MKKDAYYFPHDSNATEDPKMMLLIDELGMEGYGIFWMLLEALRNQKDYKYPVKFLKSLCRMKNADKDIVLKVINESHRAVLFEWTHSSLTQSAYTRIGASIRLKPPSNRPSEEAPTKGRGFF